jgi:mannose-6-phosphate isomerase-like protein (cupin superfamily)
MKAKVIQLNTAKEFLTDEGCYILESWNQESDKAVSIARARVSPGVTTQLHRLQGVIERYLIIQGKGKVSVGETLFQNVEPADVIIIPSGVPQQIANTGISDLIFYCICTPRFTPECYEEEEEEK